MNPESDHELASEVPGIPNSINLAAQKPEAVPSYVRRYRNIQTNSNGNNGQQQEIIIPIDTGTPGAFLDCSQSFLQFDLTIENGNPYIDYIDFNRAGAMSVFDTMSIRSNGTPIETIRKYATVWDHFMTMEGICQQEFCLYKSRQDQVQNAGWVSGHINHVKAPMVDWAGRIMDSSAYLTSGIVSNTTNIDGDLISSVNALGRGYQEKDLNQHPFNFTGVPWGVGVLTTQHRNEILRPGQICMNQFDPDNINFWPQMIGLDVQEALIMDRQSLRFQDYTAFLCNVKRVPVGCTTKLIPTNPAAGWADAVDLAAYTPPYTNNGIFTYNVCAPLLSGLIGILAKKMAPTMLLDNFQLVLTTSTYGEAFKVSMDPCRRIPGTHRDFIPYLGNSLGDFKGQVAGAVNANTFLPGYMNSYNGDYAEASMAINEAITGSNNDGTNVVTIPTTSIVRGVIGNQGVTSNANWTGIYPGPINGPYAWPNLMAGTLVANTNVAALAASADLSTIVTGHSAYFMRNSGVPQYYIEAGADVSMPCIQYGSLGLAIGNDGFACFGTYLKASRAQTARCIQNTANSNLATYAGSGRVYVQSYASECQGVQQYMPEFRISNIYFVATQVIIPDPITQQILQAAVRGDISIQTTTVQVYPNITMAPGASSQNLVIPAKVASATSAYFLFKTNVQIANSLTQYLVDSQCGYNPFSYAEYNPDLTVFAGTNVVPDNNIGYMSTSASGAFSAQLFIGVDQIPQQAIQSATEILVELEKCTHGLNQRYNNQLFGSPIITMPTTTGPNAKPGSTVFEPFAEDGFFTVYVNPTYLMDQTLVNNALWNYLTAPPPTWGSSAAPQASNTTNWNPVPVGKYFVPAYIHPRSNFRLGFDLDTWSGMSDVALCGRYMGNNAVNLRLEGCRAVEAMARTTNNSNTWNCTAIITCDARWSMQAGGNSSVFY